MQHRNRSSRKPTQSGVVLRQRGCGGRTASPEPPLASKYRMLVIPGKKTARHQEPQYPRMGTRKRQPRPRMCYVIREHARAGGGRRALRGRRGEEAASSVFLSTTSSNQRPTAGGWGRLTGTSGALHHAGRPPAGQPPSFVISANDAGPSAGEDRRLSESE